jgi:hypothetical protein
MKQLKSRMTVKAKESKGKGYPRNGHDGPEGD